jgi:cytochrome c-type biogenesis protein CcmH/NrfG
MKPFAPLVLVLSLLASAAGAAAPPSADPSRVPPPERGGSIRGQVNDGVARPLEGADVSIDALDGGPRHEQARTNAEGRFVLDALPPGRYTITARAESLSPQSFDIVVLPGSTADVWFRLIVDPAAAYRQRLAREASRQELVAKGLRLSAESDYAGAAAQFRQSVELMPDCATCFFNLAQMENQLHDDAAAQAAFEAAIKLNPDYAEAYGGLASLFNARHAFAQAIEAGTKAADLAVQYAPNLASAYRYNAGVYLWNAGRVAEARTAFEAVVQSDPGNADAHYELALALINQGDVHAAAEHLQTYLKLAPDGPNAARAHALLAGLKQ